MIQTQDRPAMKGMDPRLQKFEQPEAQADGKSVVLFGDIAAEGRDYTGGLASALLRRLLEGGAAHYDRLEDWPALTQTRQQADARASVPSPAREETILPAPF